MENIITNVANFFLQVYSYSTVHKHNIQCGLISSHFTSMCYTAFPSEPIFRILLVSNLHNVELLMRIIVLDNANATDALAKH